MDPQLADLINLQRVDSAIQEEEKAIAALPERLAAVDARIQEYQDKLDARKANLDAAQKDRRTQEGELQTIKEQLSKYETQLMAVKSNEAYRAMLKEMEATKADIAKHEDKILEDMLAVDELEAEIKELEKAFQGDRSKLEAEKKDIEKTGAEAEKRLAGHREERERLAHSLDAPVLSQYERVGTLRGGLAVVEAKDELCLGCRVKVLPQVFEEVRTGQGLRNCDSCGRFLYVVEEFAEEAGKAPPEAEAPAEPPAAPPPPAPGSSEPST